MQSRERIDESATVAPRTALIVYASSNGATAAIAKEIAAGMTAAGVDADAVSIEILALAPGRLRSVDVLGVGCPVYFLREPAYMADLFESLPSLEGITSFVFCTTGMDRVGETLERLHRKLEERDATVVGAESFRAAMSYQPYRDKGLGNDPDLPGANEFAAARSFGERMASTPDVASVELPGISRLTRGKARLLANTRFRKAVFPSPVLNTVTCTGYGSCLARCPFVGLEREDGENQPYFTETCAQCLVCLSSCPRTAIEIDSRAKTWMSTLSYRLGLH